ncbi:F0F1 ATP synthase subunit epsilon [Paraperlucidibaca wandonensis]|jgi:F-type H+-transporting ATPase subunit epsilon|uniref:ATP synthase epsilon chain n=1 Tax=Paraperlucidibaca wandonensis TaxID=1268273 RepID=A0ABW3HIS6_9GAMM|nr:F0F1 ATP synthase subunit epsilon [Paraperlucidibaca sp.]MBQ0722782.1 F0F1 ATP synthase subunit epsilon [Paraperlucidibaca sp.]MBQ0841922.1 F0F1 ATP synthase subunit epsilon [Paraperlucidibaca sp.]|tara:strand:- start:146 stop:574 length:429 start_codon:yes stop_codon:yes gene_type:complete
MAKTIHCDIVSAKESIFAGAATLVVAHGTLGDVGITPGHAPLLSQLAPGPVRIMSEAGDELVYYVSGGVIEVQPNVVTILADTALRAADMDEAAALEARKHAQEALTNQKSEMDTSVALASLAEAAAQLRTLQAMKNRSGRG